MRIEKHPILTFPSGKMVKFYFDGKECWGIEGQPIAAALHASDIKVLGHSHDKHRPRGLYCAIGNCSSCVATVDGEANVRTCVTPLKEGMIVVPQQGRGVIK